MSERIEKALLANASCLGFHWIYNREFLTEYAKNHRIMLILIKKLAPYRFKEKS